MIICCFPLLHCDNAFKVGLGGKSYQPEEDNALHQFLPQLVEFNRILEKLQTKLEEV